MAESIDISIKESVGEEISQLIELLDGDQKENLNKKLSPAALAAVQKYYRVFGRAKGWENPSAPTHGPGRKSTRFAAAVASSWGIQTADKEQISVVSGEPRLGYKVRGGVIKAVRAKFLTIPIVPEAHGFRTRDYEAATGKRLFRPKGKNVLMEKVGGSKIRAVYALKKSVRQKKVPGALPDTESIAGPVSEALLELIDEIV